MSAPSPPSRTPPSFGHVPVMLAEVLALLAPAVRTDGAVFVDATLGGAGHSRAILESDPRWRLVGLDRDGAALLAADGVLADLRGRVELRRSAFEDLDAQVRALGHQEIAGFLFDLGVSSPQLDVGTRGFSYRLDGPLDMRMDDRQALTAADVVNTYDRGRLARVLAEFGDERFAERIAAAVVAARPLQSTAELAAVVRDAIPAPARRQGGHPAKRTFQALRIEVNRELAQLPAALDAAVDLLAPHGRGVVLSYHSGEDRIVKERFTRASTGGCACPPRLPCVCGAVRTVRLLRRGARPTAAEIASNPRSESARLRAVEKLPVAA